MTASAVCATLLAALAGFVWGAGDVVQQRLQSAAAAPTQRPGDRVILRRSIPREPAAVAGAAAAGMGVAGPGGAAFFVCVAMAVVVLGRLRARTANARRTAEVNAAIAPCADLLAACLAAGATAEQAVASVAAAAAGPLRRDLEMVASGLRAGAEPHQAWATTEHTQALAPLSRAFVRAAESGAPLAATIAAVADHHRDIRRWNAEAAARRAGVLAVGPLVACFLPAFILVGIVPLVVGVATEVLTVP